MTFSVSFRNRLEKEIKIQLGNFRSVFLKSLDSKLSESLLEVSLAAVLEVPLVARFGRGRFRLENLRFVFRTGRISLGWLLQRAVVAEQLNSARFGNPAFKTDQILEQQQRTNVTNSLVVLCPAANNSSGTNTLPLEQVTVGGPGGGLASNGCRGV